MNVRITNSNDQEKELEITAPWQLIEEDYKDILKRYARLQLKGFRPGKAPIGAIESFFRNEIKADLLSSTSTRLCRKALQEAGLEAGTAIELSDMEVEKNDFLRFKASFIEMPTFELPAYHDLMLETVDKEDKLNEISRKLLDSTTIDLHQTFIDNELNYSEPAEQSSEEERNAVRDRVKLMLILKRIAAQDAIEIDEKDLEARIRMVAADNEVTPEELKAFLIENNGLSRLADSLLAEAVLSYIIDIQPETK